MSLKEKLLQDMKEAMKKKETERLSTIRMIRASIKNSEIDLGRELSEEDVLGVLARGIKQRKDSFTQYTNAGREDLAAKEEKEIQILMSYLPEQATEEELETRVREVIKETGASSQRDMGKVMKIIVSEFKGKADGGVINAIVKKSLNL
ncbi:MAG: GatB/YqeY domain-containing protein [Nitrospinota bacterium]